MQKEKGLNMAIKIGQKYHKPYDLVFPMMDNVMYRVYMVSF